MNRTLVMLLGVGLIITLIPGCDSDHPTRLRGCQVEGPNLEFGPVYLGESATRDFLILNTGTAELNLMATVQNPDFHLTAGDTVRFELTPGDTARVETVFAPTSLGVKTGTLVLSGGPCGGATLSGEGRSPCLVEPDALSFGIVSLDRPETRSLTITNMGVHPLSGSASLACPEFTLLEGAGPFTLQEGESRRVQVELAATNLGPKSCVLDLGMDLCAGAPCTGEAGRIWTVKADGSGDAPTVQAAMDSASTGETVLVYPGRYFESIDYKGKEIVVRSHTGPESTILDGSATTGAVVVFASGEGDQAVLEGLTVTGGRAEADPQWGGGILVIRASPVIRGNHIQNNYANHYGGGLLVLSYDQHSEVTWSPVIEANVIRNNWAGVLGGGISITGPGVIRGNLIQNNEVERGNGGAIEGSYPDVPGPLLIEGNRLIGNRVGNKGGAIHLYSSDDNTEIEIANNVIAENVALGEWQTDFSGGGIWLYGRSFWVHHNTIVGNRAEGFLLDPTWGGGGIALLKDGTKIIENNIIAFSSYGGGIRCESIATFTIRNNLAWANTGGDGNGACANWATRDGNLSADPLFCDREGGDYRLAENSPALLHPAGPLGAFSAAGCPGSAILSP